MIAIALCSHLCLNVSSRIAFLRAVLRCICIKPYVDTLSDD